MKKAIKTIMVLMSFGIFVSANANGLLGNPDPVNANGQRSFRRDASSSLLLGVTPHESVPEEVMVAEPPVIPDDSEKHDLETGSIEPVQFEPELKQVSPEDARIK